MPDEIHADVVVSRQYLLILAGLVALATINRPQLLRADDSAQTPNVVVIFVDDMGYGDIGPFGAEGYDTPNLDRLAAEGRRFTDFIVPSAVCSASRSALLTGCYHRRIGISGALGPTAEHGINSNEVTLAEICRSKGYATAVFGKWHLGHHPKFLPLQHGFDEYYGLPYSNDMWPYHPAFVNLPPDAAQRKRNYPNLPMIEGNRVVDAEVTGNDQRQLTTQYTEHAVDFIARNKERPFFLYVPHSMVHVPLFVSDKFAGKSERGLFGDVVMEIDWSVGQIVDEIRRQGLADNTLVIFTADNGPWLSYGDHAGTAGPLREGKGTEFEGGIREPTLMWWPGKIPADTTCDELASTIDVLPTVAALIGAELPDHPIDGHDIRPLMFGAAGAQSPHEAFWCYYAGGELQAVRDRRWKLHFPHQYRTLDGRPGGSGGTPTDYTQARIGLELFDLKNDIGESTDVAADHPDVVARLQAEAEKARRDLGDTLTGAEGSGIRPAGRLGPDDERLTW
ncbi:MAG: sulfatase [Planctomycetales bacterium]|nr:sulfatase [Planctomycetales bacterium]